MDLTRRGVTGIITEGQQTMVDRLRAWLWVRLLWRTHRFHRRYHDPCPLCTNWPNAWNLKHSAENGGETSTEGRCARDTTLKQKAANSEG